MGWQGGGWEHYVTYSETSHSDNHLRLNDGRKSMLINFRLLHITAQRICKYDEDWNKLK
jgi:hypothetical protein